METYKSQLTVVSKKKNDMVKELTAVRNELQKSETQSKKRTKLLKSKTKTLDLEKKSSAEKDLKISELSNLLTKTQGIFEKQLESTKLFEDEFKELKKQFALSLEHKVTEVVSDEKTEVLGKNIQELNIHNGNETDTNELDEEASRTSGHDVDDLGDASTGQGGEEVKVDMNFSQRRITKRLKKQLIFSNEVWPSHKIVQK